MLVYPGLVSRLIILPYVLLKMTSNPHNSDFLSMRPFHELHTMTGLYFSDETLQPDKVTRFGNVEKWLSDFVAAFIK